MTFTVRDFNVENDAECERLADMFNDWDGAWPGGFTRGVKRTGAQVRAEERRAGHLAVLIACEDGIDEIAAYCSLEAQPGQMELAYIGLLGARPSAHGKGAGQMLLREMVRRVAAMGYKQVTLHTWAGNTKAVPLYKKTGFQWVPETDVFMRNWLPAILNMPLAQSFLNGRDWYECLERELVVAPDDAKWNGMKAYSYRFRNGDRTLDLVFDAAGEGLTALETDEYALSCECGVEDAPAGQAYPVTWRVTAKTGQPMDVVLLAEAAPGLRLSAQERLQVQDTLTLTRELHIESDTTPSPENVPARRITTTLLVNGQPIVLQTGVRVVRPVEIEYSGQRIAPGREEAITVRLRSRLDRDVTGTLALSAASGLHCAAPLQTFTLPAKGWTQCAFTVTAAQAGAFSPALILEADALRLERPVTFRALVSNRALGSLDAQDELALLETLNTRIVNNLRGGTVSVKCGSEARQMLALGMGEIGPPFLDEHLNPPLFAANVESLADGDRVLLRSKEVGVSGLRLERAVTVISESVARVDYQIYNTTSLPVTAKMQQKCWSQVDSYLTAPLTDGILREPVSQLHDYPNGDHDLLAEGESLAENWIANEESGRVCGIVFAGQPLQEQRWTRLVHLTYDVGEIPAYGVGVVPPIYMIAGNGTWETVRGWWRQLVQTPPVEENPPPQTKRVLEVDIQPRMLTRDEQTVTLTVQNRRGLPLNATLSLSGAVGLLPDEVELADISRAKPFQTPLTADAGRPNFACIVNAKINSSPVAQSRKLGLLRAGREGEVQITRPESAVIAVDNGLLQFDVAPAFLGAMVALKERRGGEVQEDGNEVDVQHLRTSYPTPQPFIWANPWQGGIHPYLGWPGDPRLTREAWTGEPVERNGASGIAWKGVRVQCRPAHKDLNWLQIEAEYLTTGYSNLVALVLRCTNLTDARMTLDDEAGIAAWLNVGGSHHSDVAHAEFEGERQARTRGGFGMDNYAGAWKAVENGETRQTALLAAATPGQKAVLEDFAEEGAHLAVQSKFVLPPAQSVETLAWLVLCTHPREIDAYSLALKECLALP